MCADAGLMDEKLLRRCVIYYSTVAQYLLKLVETDGRCVRLNLLSLAPLLSLDRTRT